MQEVLYANVVLKNKFYEENIVVLRLLLWNSLKLKQQQNIPLGYGNFIVVKKSMVACSQQPIIRVQKL